MRKRVIILLAALLMVSASCVMAGSRDTLHTTFVVNTDFVPMHVVQVSVGGGLNTLLPKFTGEASNMLSVDGINPPSFGSGVGAGPQVQATYTYYFHKYVGFTAGVGFEMYTGNVHGSFADRVSLYDYDNRDNAGNPLNYYLNSNYIDFREQEQLYMVNVPVGITGRISLTDPLQLRGTVGFGMNVVAGSHFRGEGRLETTADYPIYNLHFDSDLPQHGFSNYYMEGYEGKIQNTFPISMFVFVDFGAHYQFNKRWGIYAGIYFDYTCFSTVRPTVNDAGRRPELVTFNLQDQQFTYSGMFNSKFVEAVNPLSVGVKVAVTITFLDPIKCNCEDW